MPNPVQELAKRVHAQLRRRKLPTPPARDVERFFETLYYASLRTEEGRPVLLHAVFLDSSNPDPRPPTVPPENRWSVIRFDEVLPFTVASLVKIATASDPRSSALAIDRAKNGSRDFFIWGLIDQQNLFLNFLNYDSDEGPERPGSFQATILGLGHLAVYLEYEKLAELRVNELVGKPVNLFEDEGPVRRFIDQQVSRHARQIVAALPDELREDPGFDPKLVDWHWATSVCRILLRIQRFRHGGALLITPDSRFRGLNVKYRTVYDRLRTALMRETLYQTQAHAAWDTIMYEYVEKDSDTIPSMEYLDEAVFSNRVEEVKAELEGAVWFVALLSRVDGCVLMSPDLTVRGFGAEITFADTPPRILLATDAAAKRLKQLDYLAFGTRHRSMMRYCAQVPGSLGCVISQDGAVRLMMNIDSSVIVWDNVRLQLDLPSRWQPRAHPENAT